MQQFLLDQQSGMEGTCLRIEFNSKEGRLQLTGKGRLSEIISHASISDNMGSLKDFPNESFDCITCVNVLGTVSGLDRVISEIHRVLKTGGVMFVVDSLIGAFSRFGLRQPTVQGLHSHLTQIFRVGNVVVRSYGNSLTAAGEVRGLTTKAFTKPELDYFDPRFPVVVCVRAAKE